MEGQELRGVDPGPDPHATSRRAYLPEDVSVLVPCFGNVAREYFDRCLEAMDVAEHPREIIVIDGPEEEYRDESGQLIRGFYSHALNRNFRRATGEILVILNCDTLPQPGWLNALASAFDEPDVGVAGCRLIRPDGSLQHAGVRLSLGDFAVAEEIREDLPTRDVEAVTGAACAIRKSVYELHPWNPEFDLGYEDVDDFIRIRNAGWRIRYIAESIVIHHESAVGSADGSRWRSAHRNVELFQRWATQ